MKIIFHLFFLFLFLLIVNSNPNLIPYPNNITIGSSELALSPCSVVFHFQSSSNIPTPSYYFDILDFYYKSSVVLVNCSFEVIENNIYRSRAEVEYYELTITIANFEPNEPSYPSSTTNESYTLNLDWGNWTMQAENYYGFLRGLETFAQLFEALPDPPYYNLNYLPIFIQDAPAFAYRGIMMDTARHFINLDTLKHVLDGMLFHKLNVFHWHLTDDESFPLQLQSKPIITQSGAYSLAEIYSQDDIMEIVEYARMRGIRVVPEVDSPAHSYSWTFSSEYSDIGSECFNYADYNGQLDPTLNKTYDVVQSILNDLNEYFPDEYVHLGNDEAVVNCWEANPSIQAFMQAHNLTNGIELQQYYKDRALTLLTPPHRAIYWVDDSNFNYSESDILEYWSSRGEYSLIQNYTNKVIFANYDYFYLDLGYGNVFGAESWAPFNTWLNIYSFDPYPVEIDPSRILGAECPLWAEINSVYTTDNHLWSRASLFAERIWNPTINKINGLVEGAGIREVAARVYGNEKRLEASGFAPSPITSEYCSQHLFVCFPSSS